MAANDLALAPAVQPSVMGPSPVTVVDNFLPKELAAAMRQDVEAHFGTPYGHRPDTHQVWNYWYVPGQYTYLRTRPQKVIDQDRMKACFDTLANWCRDNLGLDRVTWPFLSLYLPGCRQNWHNDTRGGRFAFVLSLTKNERQTQGGETLVMRDGDTIRSRLTAPSTSKDFFASVAPLFNRLVVFDDRASHAVERLDGSMNPVEGRIVLHGHIAEGEPHVTGALPQVQVITMLTTALRNFTQANQALLDGWLGPLSCRLAIEPSGRGVITRILVDRVLHATRPPSDWANLRPRLLEVVEAIRFPMAAARTFVILPIMLGGPVNG
jgi:2OG-Fe(II) oxygenase superfamily